MNISSKRSAIMETENHNALRLKLRSEFFKHAGDEKINVDIIGGCAYAFGSELATLRLFKAYHKCDPKKDVRQGYSTNLSTFYFSFNLEYM